MSSAKVLRRIYEWSDGQIIEAKVENIVYTMDLGIHLNLEHVTRQLFYIGCQHNPNRFAAVIIRHKNPKIAYLLFAKGKVVCTGAKDEFHASYLINCMVED